ncbi:hypothetical protein [Weissella viridescens]|uniref:hypothetical protein n=1 Tax=Weissella viridescens TaxID=1629 RepID=UPI003AF20939
MNKKYEPKTKLGKLIAKEEISNLDEELRYLEFLVSAQDTQKYNVFFDKSTNEFISVSALELQDCIEVQRKRIAQIMHNQINNI